MKKNQYIKIGGIILLISFVFVVHGVFSKDNLPTMLQAILFNTKAIQENTKTIQDISKNISHVVSEKKEIPEPSFGGVGSGFFLTGCATGNSTSTFNYINDNDTASTTLSCLTDRADIVNLLINIRPSSTVATTTFQWEYQFSDNNIDWFGEDRTSTVVEISTTTLQSYSLVHSTSSLLHVLPLSKSQATTSKAVIIDPLGMRYTRVRFHINGVNAALWAQMIRREPNR